MVADYVHLEYGYEREGIKSFISQMNLDDDIECREILNRVEAYKNNSFLNI